MPSLEESLKITEDFLEFAKRSKNEARDKPETLKVRKIMVIRLQQKAFQAQSANQPMIFLNSELILT